MYEEYKALTVERRGPVLWVTMNRVPHVDRELSTIFRVISRDPETRAVVLTGPGERVFNTGGNPGGGMQNNVNRHGYWIGQMPGAREIVLNMLECDKPVIGRINGHAVGVGCSIALCCDITVVIDKAKVGDTHVKLGLVAGDGGALLWPHLVGWMQSKRWLLTGDVMTGKEAADIGLMTFAVPEDQLDETVDLWAGRMASGPLALGLTKRALNMAIRQQAQVYMDAHLGLETMSYMSEDHPEGLKAFQENRPPNFVGR